MSLKVGFNPGITLSPTCLPQRPIHEDESSESQTTPKLSRRERAASFSRLLSSEKFKDLRTSVKERATENEEKKNSKHVLLEKPPLICVTPSSPCKGEDQVKEEIYFSGSEERGSDSHLLPFSPHLLTVSPKYLSPQYAPSTPTRSPLYNAKRNGTFLGKGSFGNVTLCIHKGYKFALKVVDSSCSSVGEANFLNVLHPHIVRILHIGRVIDKILIFMEFAGHCNLKQVLDTKSQLDIPRKLSFCIQILSGLRHCHRNGIVHADVKPSNVIVSPHGVCKLCDFGHSFKLASSQVQPTVSDDIIGTAVYAAPEVLRGSRPTPQSDIFSFGILLWQVQSREIPFSQEHPHVVIYKVAHYGVRPIFNITGDPIEEKFADIAKLCWCSSPTERLEASQVLCLLQALIREVKELKVF